MTAKKKRPWDLNRLALDVTNDALLESFFRHGKRRCGYGRTSLGTVQEQGALTETGEIQPDNRVAVRTSRIVRSLIKGDTIARTALEARTKTDVVARQAVEIGERAAEFHHDSVRNLNVPEIFIHAHWAFSYGLRSRYLNPEGAGATPLDLWLWAASDPLTGLVVNWGVGCRDGKAAARFLGDTMSRLEKTEGTARSRPRILLTNSGLPTDRNPDLFMIDVVDSRSLNRLFGDSKECAEGLLCPAGAAKDDFISESAIAKEVSTDLVHGLAKRVRNLNVAVSLHFAYANFVRAPSCGCDVPAVAIGLLKHPLTQVQLCEQMI